MSNYKYQELENYLKNIPAEKKAVSITFKQIENILGFPLPPSAYTHSAWWANQTDTSSRAQARAWSEAGFLMESVQQNRHGSVQFKRRFLG